MVNQWLQDKVSDLIGFMDDRGYILTLETLDNHHLEPSNQVIDIMVINKLTGVHSSLEISIWDLGYPYDYTMVTVLRRIVSGMIRDMEEKNNEN